MRLKAILSDSYDEYVKKFQFLLVRLKDSRNESTIVRSIISIPTGAIKSLHALNNNGIVGGISIPTGAIKSKRQRSH